MISKSWRRRLAPVVGVFALTGLAFGAATAGRRRRGAIRSPSTSRTTYRRAGAGRGRRLRHVSPGEDGQGDLHDADPDRRRTSTPTARRRRPAQRDLDRGQPDRPGQHHRRRQRLPARPQPRWPRERDGAVPRPRHLRRRPAPGRSTRCTPNSAYQATGDPAVAFDAAGHATTRTLGFRFVGPVNAHEPGRPRRQLAATGARPGTSRASPPGSGNVGQRRRPARQGVHRRLGPRQRDRHLRRLPARPEGRVRRRPDLRSA